MGTLAVHVSKHYLIIVVNSSGVGHYTRCIVDTTTEFSTFFRRYSVTFENLLFRHCRGFNSNIVRTLSGEVSDQRLPATTCRRL
ncbi:hypothetical protein C490_13795 [Natronobacterium gregoryi SP2]|uniref:Uncharacterized protein n=1 Tax=Natronobacterium gregoryi (strain ATCC 43098 / DSM 3393 / CCM 3738 / CIP 104747 / IAM 13177 / JCM 8860 / NBRC 102187 / NCIMB 2189 / SP2) TaxID=797304 RepID=L9XV34_NATGS|nr:hypothetical protein C490_13795 [Natronobacterium gregoryi SP2]